MADKKRELETHVVRWQVRKMEKESQTPDLPTSLPRTVVAVKDPTTKKRKLVAVKPEDDALTNNCIGIANRHILKLTKVPSEDPDPKRAKLIILDEPPREIARKTTKIIINTAMKPLEEFPIDHPRVEPEFIEEDPTAPYTISQNALSGMPSLRGMLDKQRQYFAQRDSKKVQDGIIAAPKPVISAQHIAKVLFEPYGLFGPCVLAGTNGCQAQLEPTLAHPMSKTPIACMAYCSPEEVTAIAGGFQKTILGGQMCEMCERYAINRYVLEKGLESHVVEFERPNRYYKSDVPGEYSRRGMIQPTQGKGVRFTDGVFGDVRCWNTSDFVPVMGVIKPNDSVVTSTLLPEQYKQLTEDHIQNSGFKYVRGWREVKPFYNLNERTFLETHQISPYLHSFVDVEQSLDIALVLKGYFERRETQFPNFALLFSDLMECVHDDNFYTQFNVFTRYPYYNAEDLDLWRNWCLHKFDSPPDLATHRIYYAVMIRCNTVQLFLTKNAHTGPADNLDTKLKLFIEGHMPLIKWMDENKAISDSQVHTLIFDPGLQIEMPVLLTYYPKFDTHFRQTDCEFLTFVKRTYAKRDPLDVLHRHYIEEQADRFSQLLHMNLPTDEGILKKVATKSLNINLYTEITEAYQKLCIRLKFQHRGAWPALLSKVPQKDVLPPNVTRKEWRKQRDRELVSQMRTELKSVLTVLRAENREYEILLTGFAKSVFCSFTDTLTALLELSIEDRGYMINYCGCFDEILPLSTGIIITGSEVNGKKWEEHLLLLACLLRVYLTEHLHSLELEEKIELRYNLRLFRNSHLRLVRKITENRPVLFTDEELLTQPVGKVLSIFDIYKPEPKGELHEGMLPDVCDGLVNVDFMGNNGMDEQELIKILFKVLDRCCNGREFPLMLNKMCEQNPDFNRLILLMLELSLKGLYTHDTVVVSFYRSLALDEMFEHSESPDVWASIQRFIRDNATLAKEAISESLIYMLQFLPHLRDMLTTVYEDLSDWRMRIIANMDMVRYCFTATGDFTRISETVYQRIHLDSNKKIYRHTELGFVKFMCDQIWDFDIARYAKRVIFEKHHQTTSEQKEMVNCFVRSISPIQVIKLEALKIAFLTARTLDIIAAISLLFEVNGAKLSSSGPKHKQANPVHTKFLELDINQYGLMSYFFETLQSYQNIRTVRITNLNVLKAQMTKLCERRGVKHVGQLSALATKVIYSPCCGYFKNAFPLRMDQAARGFDEVIFNMTDQTYTCGKKEHKANSRAAPRAIRMGKKPDLFNTKVARQQTRENKKPVCSETEVLIIDVLGEVVETQTTARFTKGKTANNKNLAAAKRRRKNLPQPTAPLWVTPCCGIIYEYDWQKWTPNCYACGVCKVNSDMAESLNKLICMCCRQTIDRTYQIIRCWDDVYTQQFHRMAFCSRCLHQWKHFGQLLCGSHVIHGINDPTFAQQVALRYT